MLISDLPSNMSGSGRVDSCEQKQNATKATFNNCEIKMQLQGSGVYFGGQRIEGQVLINSYASMSSGSNIQINLAGFGEVHWTEEVI